MVVASRVISLLSAGSQEVDCSQDQLLQPSVEVLKVLEDTPGTPEDALEAEVEDLDHIEQGQDASMKSPLMKITS